MFGIDNCSVYTEYIKVKVKQKEKIEKINALVEKKCTNMIINGVTYMILIYSGLLLSTCKKIIYT